MRTTLMMLLLGFVPSTALAQTIYRPKGGNEAGIDLALVDDAWADDGFGIGGHYEMVLVRDAGPGHVSAGGSGLVAFLDDEFRGCDREETILTGAGRLRYVLGFSKVVKPYGGIGLGLYAVNRDFEDCDPDRDDDDSDLGIGIPIVIGVDFQFDALALGVSANFHETSAGDDDDEDFNHIGLGVRWRW